MTNLVAWLLAAAVATSSCSSFYPAWLSVRMWPSCLSCAVDARFMAVSAPLDSN